MKLFVCPLDEPMLPRKRKAEVKAALPPKACGSKEELMQKVAALLHTSVSELRQQWLSRNHHFLATSNEDVVLQAAPKRALPVMEDFEERVAPKPKRTLMTMLMELDPIQAITDGKPLEPPIPIVKGRKHALKRPLEKRPFEEVDFESMSEQPVPVEEPEPLWDVDDDEPYDDQRPMSPGRELDHLFTFSEINVSKPKFKAQHIKEMFHAACSDRNQYDKIAKQINTVQQNLDHRYAVLSDISSVEKKMRAAQARNLYAKYGPKHDDSTQPSR